MLLASSLACALLLASCLALELASRRLRHPPPPPAPLPPSNPAFRRFRRSYYCVYFPALAADWLQGPFLYQLYRHYRFAHAQIAGLYLGGVTAAVAAGWVAAPLADAVGRKKSCVVFSFLYSFSCLVKLSRQYFALLGARVLGGLAAAVLFAALEAWYVEEHVGRHDFPADWLALTFSQAAFWNHFVAVAAGAAAEVGAQGLALGPVAPFLAAIPFLVASGCYAWKNWEENYGPKATWGKSCGDPLRCLLSDRRVFLLGAVQMLFESVVFVFIFLWTPLLQPHGAPLGIVFAAFMAASALGSSLYRLLVSASLLQPSHLLLLAVLLLFLAFLALLFATQPVQAFGAFLFVEFSCGLYFPAMGFLRRKIVPQKDRAGVTNWFHLPLNLLVWLVLLGWPPTHGASDMGSACALLALLALLVATGLFALIRRDAELRCPTDAAASDL